MLSAICSWLLLMATFEACPSFAAPSPFSIAANSKEQSPSSFNNNRPYRAYNLSQLSKFFMPYMSLSKAAAAPASNSHHLSSSSPSLRLVEPSAEHNSNLKATNLSELPPSIRRRNELMSRSGMVAAREKENVSDGLFDLGIKDFDSEFEKKQEKPDYGHLRFGRDGGGVVDARTKYAAPGGGPDYGHMRFG